MNYLPKNNFLKKNEMWFLQTRLTLSEVRKVTEFLCNIRLNGENVHSDSDLENFANIRFLLSKTIKNEERLQFLFSELNDKKWTFNQIDNIYTRFELEDYLKKDLSTSLPLAYQYIGHVQSLKRPIVAIVGSRHPTYYGRLQTEYFAKQLSLSGFTILSGGAIGVDSIANRVAINHGRSCAIVGSGVKNLYPAANFDLFHALKSSPNGLILSEFDTLSQAQKWHFPRRNYSIAALADFVLIIEATLTSGSLITANAAADFSVDVGALPGNINCTNSEGTNLLIKNGAYCITHPNDIIDLFKHKWILS